MKAVIVEPEVSIARQQFGKQTTIEELLGTMFLFGPWKAVIKKISVENHQSSSGVPSER
jgi:hypothetical protein